MEIQTRRQDDGWVVVLKGSADVVAADELREVLLNLLSTDTPRAVCDLSQTDFMCSDALGVLITAHLKASGAGGYLRLAAPTKRLREILETTRLTRLFAIFPDVAGALKT
ncbi:MAG: STAS domain-containing protein [Planctomycetia bacterium]|nr:STAS domain-containing protein [Planctomycetia bacterium]